MDYDGLLKDLELIDLRTQATAVLYQGRVFSSMDDYVRFSRELLAFKRHVKEMVDG